MAARKSLKDTLQRKRTVGVRLSDEEFAALTRAAEQESAKRREMVHEAALLREVAMPRIRELLEVA